MKTNWIKSWQDFLDSLSTKGGNIFMMFIALLVLLYTMHHVERDTQDAAMISAVHDMMVGFGAALLAVLSGSSSRQQMADRVETLQPTPPTTTTAVTNAGTVNVTPPPVAKEPTDK